LIGLAIFSGKERENSPETPSEIDRQITWKSCR